jgi:hypothetical protein
MQDSTVFKWWSVIISSSSLTAVKQGSCIIVIFYRLYFRVTRSIWELLFLNDKLIQLGQEIFFRMKSKDNYQNW